MSTKKVINCSKLKDVATYLKKKDEASGDFLLFSGLVLIAVNC